MQHKIVTVTLIFIHNMFSLMMTVYGHAYGNAYFLVTIDLVVFYSL
jgi:hypothetical protein